MAGERKKPTAAEKGKAVMVEEKKKDEGIEAALNAVHAAERSRPRGPLIREPPATAAESPALRRSGRTRTPPTGMDTRGTPRPRSRKRARDDDLLRGLRGTPDVVPPTPPPLPPIMDEDDYRGLFSKASRSVVTVAFDMFAGSTMETTFRTGFILIDEESYSLVLTTSKPHADGRVNRYFVYFEGENSKTRAYKLATFEKDNLLILIVQTDRRHEAISFSFDRLGYEAIFTVCAMSTIRLNDRANAPLIKELEGSLGLYKGTVGTPCCDALNACREHIVGSEKYFELGLSLHDDIITLRNIDAKKRTAEIAVSAPVFCLNGKTAGMIFSEGGWADSKIGLSAKSIVLAMETGLDGWEEYLKKWAKDWFEARG